ncbi:aminoglycoside phosphotransferase family protein [Kineosporia rhizophila]|uniref:phosphotransferase family protein n=1 Tax=Kineosporia rhizophila TaxID=84633 RepID=UPI001E3C7E1A|nr:aminoglycoside phosphotransferase family protein [Kineosporia rhizophila]
MSAEVVRRSLAELGLRPRGTGEFLPAGPGHRRRTLHHAPVTDASNEPADVVLKYVLSPTPAEEQNLAWEHQATVAMHAIAVEYYESGRIPYIPVPEPLAAQPLRLQMDNGSSAMVAVRRFVHTGPQPFTTRSLGRLIAVLHQLGTDEKALGMLTLRPANVLGGIEAGWFARTLSAPGHPFRDRPDVVRKLLRELPNRMNRALEADPRPLLIHRDLHPLNCVAGTGGVLALDWAEAGWGTRSDDFAWLHLAVTRYGAPPRVLNQALAGYQEIDPGAVPGLDQVRAAGEVKELVCLAFSLANAGLGPDHRAQAERELAVLEDPGAEPPGWQALFNPAIFSHPLFRPVRLPSVISLREPSAIPAEQGGNEHIAQNGPGEVMVHP